MRDAEHQPIETVRLSDRDKRRLVETLDQEADLAPVAREKRSVRATYHAQNVVVTMTPPNGASVPHRVLSRNLSRWGLAFIHGQYVYEGTHCEVMLTTLEREPYAVEGQVLRCRHIGGIMHEVSVRFDEPIELDLFVTLNVDQAQRHALERSDDLAACEPVEVENYPTGLVIDPQPIERKLYGLWLSEIGLRSHEVIGGEHALNLVEREPIDLVLVDWFTSPDRQGNGAALALHLRESGFNGAIIGMSSDDSHPVHQQMVQAGCNTFVAKPFEKPALQAIVEQQLMLAVGPAGPPIVSSQAGVESMQPLIHEFVSSAREQVAGLHKSIRLEDYTQLTRRCLQLKSAAGFGFDTITDLACNVLDTLEIENREFGVLKANVDELIDSLRRLRTE